MTDYARHEHHDFLDAAGQALADPPLAGRAGAPDRARSWPATAAATPPWPTATPLRDHAKRIKEHTLAHLDRYLEQLEASVAAAAAATSTGRRRRRTPARIVVDIAQQAGCRRVVKSKSMTTEEVHLNPALEAAGLEVTETDFGEFIIQLAGERPSHLVAPAVHHTRESIARILSAHTGDALPDDPASLARAGRRLLRDEVRRRPTWASPAPTSPWPRRARSSWSPTRATPG